MDALLPPQDPGQHRVLLVNDDGIHASGLQLLERLVRAFTDDVWVVAPDEEKSGASHSVSITSPIRVRQLGERCYAVKGTPTDCVLLAYWELLAARPPTVVIAGINHGENLAEDITYSGTAAGAIEAAVLGLRAIALSQVYELGGQPRLDTAEHFGPDILRRLLSCAWQPGTFVNVNFPNAPVAEVTGVRVTTQGRRLPGSFRPIGRSDGRNVPYYWIRLAYDPGDPRPGTDLHAIRDNAISVTPMQVDLTARPLLLDLERLFGGPGNAAPIGASVEQAPETRRRT